MAAGTTYTPISTYTVSSPPSFTALSLSSIPQTYTDLILVISSSVTNAGYSDTDIRMRPNNNSSSIYSETKLIGNGSSASSTGQFVTDNSLFYLGNTGSAVTVNTYQFMNYTNTTTYKTILCRTSNNYGGVIRSSVGLWKSTTAISSIWMDLSASSSNNWSTGSIFSLYGIKAA
jgi:hypothetical protein